MLLPVILFAVFMTRSRFEHQATASKPPLLPWFAVAFAALVLLGSTGWVPASVIAAGTVASQWCLIVSMVAIGMKTQFRSCAA